MLESSFVRHDLNSLLPLAIHDDNLPGDIRTTLRLNHEWRIFLMAIMDDLLEDAVFYVSDAQYDNLYNEFLDMMEDFYT